MTSHAEAQPVAPPAPDAKQPARLGKYVIKKRLGAGGMGTVYLALDTELHRTVALKVLARERAENPTLVKRFKSEGQAAARLEHENIVKVFEAGEIDGQLYLALEYVDGVDVQELVRKRDVLPVRRSIEIVRQVAAALQHAADKKLVHRDVKPSNILIRKDGVAKLTDMGLARAIDDTTNTNITRAGMTVGTVDYMSPEQARDSKSADIRSDLYSLGCSWFHMLTGQLPFPEGSVTAKLQAHATAPPPDPRRINERIPEAIVAVIQRLMAKRPIDRYQTPAELIEDLKQAHLARTGVEASLLAGLAEAHTEASPESPSDGDAPPADVPKKLPGSRGRSKSGKSTTSVKSAQTAAPRTARSKKRKAAKSDAKEPRELPPRSANPAALGGAARRTIDPELLKFAFFGVLALAFIGIVGWAFMQMSKVDDGPSDGGLGQYLAQRQGEDNDPQSADPPPAYRPPTPPPPPVEEGPAVSIPTTDVRDFDRPTPFPGAERASFDPDVHDVPRWVYEARALPRTDLPKFSVNTGASGGDSFADAVARVPKAGGVIEFVGRGPFIIDLAKIADLDRIILRGAAGSQPVLLLPAPLRMSRGQFEFDGVHIVAPAGELDAGTALITVDSGTLLFRNSSLTLADPAPNHVKAIELRSGATPSRCVLENVLMRGNNLTAVSSVGPRNELVAGNCLLAGGDAPTVMIANAAEAGAASVDQADQPVVVELLASVLATRASGFVLSHAPNRAPPHVRLWTGDVVFVAGDATTGPWMQLNRWPERPVGDLENPRARGLDWSSRNTYWLGWNTLVRMTPPEGSEILVSGESEWMQFWRPDESHVFLRAAANAVPLDHSRLDPVAFRDYLAVALSGDTAKSIEVPYSTGKLPPVPESLVERVMAVSGRPRLPRGFDSMAGKTLVRFDLDKGRTLNRFLNSAACPDGARVILFGSGRKLIEPVRIQNKSLRLEFQSEETPLSIEPVPVAAGERPAALFQVEGGRLDLVGARIRIPSSATRKYPLRLLQVVDGSFSVQNCFLQGQMRDGATDAPLIEWRRSGESVSAASQFALIENSLLVGRFDVFRGDMADRLIEIRNSIVLSQHDGISLSGAPAGGDGHFVLKDCTLSAGRSAVVVSEQPDGSRINLYVDHTVFGPSLNPIDGGPIVVTYPSAGDALTRIVWWEHRNAYSSQIQTFRSVAGEPPARQNFQDVWQRGWGPDHVLDALTGGSAVLFDSPAQSVEKAVATDFRLSSLSDAAKWGAGGGPVGARIEEIGPDGRPPADKDSTGQPRPGGPVRTVPGF